MSKMYVIVISVLMVLMCASAHAGTTYSRHGLSGEQYQELFTRLTQKGYRLTDITGYSVNKRARYAVTFEKTSGPKWVAKHGLSGSAYQSEFARLKKKGYQPVHVNGYTVKGRVYFAAIWHARSGAYVARHNLSSSAYQKEFNAQSKAGYRLVHVDGYSKQGKAYFTAIWRKHTRAVQAQHNLSSAGYQAAFEKWTKKGYRLHRVSGYRIGGQDRYAAIWVKGKAKGGQQRALHGISGLNYQGAWENMHYQGYRLKHLNAWSAGSSGRFAGVWEKTGGLKSADVRKIDQLVNTVMKDHDVPGLSIALSKDGRLVFAKGYGYADKSRKLKTSPRHLFRLASVSKPVTGIAMMKLMEKYPSKVNMETKVFGRNTLLGTKYGETPYSSKVKRIKVSHLLRHESGGWSNGHACTKNSDCGSGSCNTKASSPYCRNEDPMFRQLSLSQDRLIDWALKNRKLQNLPGTKHEYSNFGYCLLGRIIEVVSGQSYEGFVKRHVLKPAGIKDMHIGEKKRSDRRSNEVVYYDSGAYDLLPERMDAHGGWIASSIDILKLMVHADGKHPPKDILSTASVNRMKATTATSPRYGAGWSINSSGNWWHTGAMSGTRTILVRTQSGYGWAILVNTKSAGALGTALDQLGWDVKNAVQSWPSADLF